MSLPTAKKQVPKSPSHLLNALEDHLATLASMLIGLQSGDAAYVKDIATKLRLLICGSSGQQGFLWDLMEEVGGSDVLQMRHGKIDLSNPLTRGMAVFDTYRFVNAQGTPFPLENVSLREHVADHEVAFVEGVSLTCKDLIKEMAEHSGTAHETPGVSRQMAKANAFRIGDVQPYIPMIDRVARWTLAVGESVLESAVITKGHVRRRKSITFPPVVNLEQVKFLFPMDGPKFETASDGKTMMVGLDAAAFPRAKEQANPVFFPPLTVGSVVFSFQATRKGRLRLTASGLLIPYFTYEGVVTGNSHGLVMLCVTWRALDIRVYVNGERVLGLPSP